MAEQEGISLVTNQQGVAADEGGQVFESTFWTRLTHAADADNFTANWLDIQCRLLGGVIRGVVVLRAARAASFAPVALWPEGIEGSPRLAAVVDQALSQRRVAVQGAGFLNDGDLVKVVQ